MGRERMTVRPPLRSLWDVVSPVATYNCDSRIDVASTDGAADVCTKSYADGPACDQESGYSGAIERQFSYDRDAMASAALLILTKSTCEDVACAPKLGLQLSASTEDDDGASTEHLGQVLGIGVSESLYDIGRGRYVEAGALLSLCIRGSFRRHDWVLDTGARDGWAGGSLGRAKSAAGRVR